MEIIVKKGEGVSQAIKRKLLEAGAKNSDFAGSIWSKIQQSLKDNESTIEQKGGTSKIGDLWTTLTANVKTFIGDVIKITEETWNKIKSFVGLDDSTSETSDTLSSASAGETTGAEETGEAEETTGTGETGETGESDETEETETYTTDSIKVKVPPKYMSAEAKRIIEAQKQGKAKAEEYLQGKVAFTDSYNVAYFLNVKGVIDKMNEGDVQNCYNELLDRIFEYKKFPKTKDQYKAEFNKLTLAEKKYKIRQIVNGVIRHDNEVIKQSNDEKMAYNKDRAKMQEQFDKANKLLVEVANMNPKPEVKTAHDEDNVDWAIIKLPDGRLINVRYDENGEIILINISHDTTPDHNADGTEFDGAEVQYTKERAYVNTDKSNDEYEYDITSGYNWDAIKQIAEAIFGKGPKAE